MCEKQVIRCRERCQTNGLCFCLVSLLFVCCLENGKNQNVFMTNEEGWSSNIDRRCVKFESDVCLMYMYMYMLSRLDCWLDDSNIIILILADITSQTNRLKCLQTVLSHLLSCELSLAGICTHLQDTPVVGADDIQPFCDEAEKLMGILQQRLNFTLMSLVKASTAAKKTYVHVSYRKLSKCVQKLAVSVHS